MNDKIAEIAAAFTPEDKAAWIVNLWETYNNQRQTKLAEWSEVESYIFATDTTTTTNNLLPWKNTTTTPKLCQIRDNLHSNYISSLFPNDKWLKWNAYSKDDARKEKAEVITAYMDNKAREGDLRSTISRLLYDYIDYGNAFSIADYEKRFVIDNTGNEKISYIGPILRRISPRDIVFNPMADSFEKSFKIIRSTHTLGELVKNAKLNPAYNFWTEYINNRIKRSQLAGQYTRDDFDKAVQYSIDGFGSLYEYYMGAYVEVLEFWGDYFDAKTGEFAESRLITVIDRMEVVRDIAIPTYSGEAPIRHAGWRFRPDNLWAMGPLDNLVGMQYRMDHLTNMAADAMDLLVHPPIKVVGQVEEFDWTPGAQINIDEGGDVGLLTADLSPIITAANNIQYIENQMEQYAGAPREAMGIRTPGEKTAFEVQTLENAGGRIFQEKITNFEVTLLEKSLNDMLEQAHRNLEGVDVIRVIDNDIGAQQFMEITKSDITANGVLRPVGARHFAQQAQDLQNLAGVFSGPLGQMVAPHTSSINLSKYLNDTLGITGWEIFKPNVAVAEQQDTQRLVNQAQENLQVEGSVPAIG